MLVQKWSMSLEEEANVTTCHFVWITHIPVNTKKTATPSLKHRCRRGIQDDWM
jgi:hypothetical protein